MKPLSVFPTFKQDMQAGHRQLGIRSQFCSPLVAEALGLSGYDYVYLDMEHSPNDVPSIVAQSQALAATPAHAVVRLPTLDVVLIGQLLDQGIENIVVPMVEDVAAAKAAVEATRYPPRGARSVGKMHRGNRYGAQQDYAATIEDRLCLVVQAESRRALHALSAIAAVDGVDGVLIGPGDLAADLGHLGDSGHPEVEAAIAGAVATIRATGTFAGMSTNDPAAGRRWLDAGCAFVSIAGDLPLLVGAARRSAQAARGA